MELLTADKLANPLNKRHFPRNIITNYDMRSHIKKGSGDGMSTARLLRGIRRAKGLTQRQLASLAGITQPSLADIERSAHDSRVGSFNELIGVAGYKLFALPTLRSAAASWADLIYEELRSDRASESVAFRALIGLSDDLVASDFATRVALCVTPPAPCGDVRFDAAIAAIAEYHLERDGLPVPNWVYEDSRVLDSPWVLSPYTEEDEVPQIFRAHGVLLAASELASV
jgi:transcriptional regulator with XRE-family HTH domain